MPLLPLKMILFFFIEYNIVATVYTLRYLTRDRDLSEEIKSHFPSTHFPTKPFRPAATTKTCYNIYSWGRHNTKSVNVNIF